MKKKVVLAVLTIALFSQFAVAKAPVNTPDWGNVPTKKGWVDKGDRYFDPKWNLSIPKERFTWANEAFEYREKMEKWIKTQKNK